MGIAKRVWPWATVIIGALAAAEAATPEPAPVPCYHKVHRISEEGVSFPFNYTGELFGNFSGGCQGGAAYDGILKVGIQLDLEKLGLWKGGKFLLSGLNAHGKSITSNYVGDFNGVSNIDAYDSLRLYEAWFDQGFFDDKLSIRVGQLLADSEFCISETGCLFINSAFGAIPLLSKNLNAPVYPVAAPGVRFRISPNPSMFGQFSAYVGDAGDQTTTNRHGTRFFRGSRGTLLMGEIGYVFNPPPENDNETADKKSRRVERPLSCTLKLGGFYDSAKVEDFGGNGTHQYAVYLILDQELWHEHGDADRGLHIFGRVGGAPPNSSAVALYFDGGFNYRGLFPGRDKDICGMGFSYTKISSDTLDEDSGTLQSHHETILEATYQAALTDWCALQPDIQYIFNPGATGSQHNALVAGLRFSVTF